MRRQTQNRLVPDRVRELLNYDRDTGVFSWRVSRRGGARAGEPYGHIDSSGHVQLKIEGRLYLAHRVAWLYVHGEWPAETIDHINNVPTDNRLVNLRLATKGQNNANCKARASVSGLKGATPYRGKWKAQINVHGEKHYLGLYPTPQAAHEAYMEAARRHFGEFARAS